MPTYKQAGRLMQFTSVLGQDELLIESLEGVEGLSRLFDFHAELFADAGAEIDPSDILGTKATVAVQLLDVSGTRYINGLVAAFEQTTGDADFDVYRAHIVPSLWQLTLNSNCRVFQNLTVMDIIKKVISTYSLAVSDVTTFAYQTLDYCTQYDETDFAFISRIAEQFGIFYWFEHTDSDNTVYFGDARSAYSPCPDISSVKYAPQARDNEDMYRSVVSDFRVTAAMVTGKHSARDYDYRPYSQNAVGALNSTHEYGENAFEQYGYPTGEEGYVKLIDKQLTTPAHGEAMLTAQRDASDVSANVFHGISTARTFIPGFTFDLTNHPRDAWNQTYLLMEVAHHLTQLPPYRGEATTEAAYTNRFSGIEAERLFRPPARTPKPRIYGPQTGVVVVPSGEDMYLDKLGRVSVRFFWDRDRGINTVDNTWVRVAQPWAGNGWGTYFWPRVNDEVLIQFLNGDPDNPVVIGSVYNGVNVPKYALPDMSTRTGILTRSSKGGAAANANELRFEDKTGSEQIFINAEKDMDHRIENDLRTYVMGQDSLFVDKDQLEQIGGNYNRTIKGNSVEAITGKQDLNITAAVTHQLGAGYSLNLTGDSITGISGKQDLKTGDAVSHEYGGKFSLKISGDHDETNSNYAMASDQTVYIKGGMTVVIEGGMQLSLKAAGSFVDIGPSGVSISGPMVLINSGGAAGSGQAPQVTAPGSPQTPAQPKAPDKADDGTKGGKM